jgi:hypothetical protein
MTSRPQFRPWLIAFGLAYVLLTLVGRVMRMNLPQLRPGGPSADVLAYVQGNVGPIRVLALLGLVSAAALAVWTAVVYQCLRTLGVNTAFAALSLVGGVIASGLVAFSGLVTWVESRANESAPLAGALSDMGAMTAGPGYAVFFGLLLAGVSLPMLQLRAPRTVRLWAVLGLVVAVIAQFAATGLLLSDPSEPKAIPPTRALGIIWLVAVSVVLPMAVAARRRETDVDAAATTAVAVQRTPI